VKKKNYKYNLWGILISALVVEVLLWALIAVVFFVLLSAIPGLKIQRPELAWLLLIGPFMFALFALLVWSKNRRFDRFSDPELLGNMVSDVSSVNVSLKFTLWRLAAFALAIALTGPQLGSKMTEAKVSGVDIMVAVDVSNSMLAEDLKPNRIVLAKRALERLLDNLHGDRVGIVVFAGQAFVQLPITNDYAAGKLFLSSINTDIVPVQGTAIGAAIEMSLESFDFESPGQKVIVVISDGENHEDDALGAATEANAQGVKVYTIGMGSAKGSPIPDMRGNQQMGFKKDQDGSTVITKLNESMLRDIADAGGGRYIRASNAEVGLNTLMEELNELEKADMGAVSYAEYEDRYQFFLAFALLCMFLEVFVRERKGKFAQQIKIFES
jgi:Ca-activated chloride channel family protein